MQRTNLFTLIPPPPLNIYTESKYYSLVEYLGYDKKESLLQSASSIVWANNILSDL